MRHKIIYALLLLQCLGLAAWYAWHHAGLSQPTVMLKTLPVDPRDYLRGDYIILHYEISQLPLESQNTFQEGTPVYVILGEEDGFATSSSVQDWPPERNQRFIKGRVRGPRIEFDLEKYFVPEGQGNPPPPITVEVTLRPDGTAQIKQLHAQGSPWPRKN
jgi:uncharacterized membrane-anchored protein